MSIFCPEWKSELDLSVLVASRSRYTLPTALSKSWPCPKIVHNFPKSHPLASLVACPEENSIKIPRNFLFIIWKTRPWSPVFRVRKICEDISQIITKYRLNNLSLVPVQNRKTNIAMAECGLAIAFLPAIYVTKPENHPDLFHLYSDDPSRPMVHDRAS